jgi:hypothetical protein
MEGKSKGPNELHYMQENSKNFLEQFARKRLKSYSSETICEA